VSGRSGLPAPVWLLPGLLLGFLAGGLQPRSQLAELEAEVQRLKDEQIREARRAARRSPLSVIGLDRAGAGGEEPLPETPALAEDLEALEGDPASAAAPEAVDSGAPQPLAEGPQGFGAEFDLAVEAQQLRREQTRAALIEQADLDGQEIERLDEIAFAMNERLGAMGEELLAMMDSVNADQEPSSRELLGLTHEVTGVLYEAQTAMDELIGDTSEVDRSAAEVWNLVDLEVFREAVEAAEDGRPGR
jgi:hypothetical protein